MARTAITPTALAANSAIAPVATTIDAGLVTAGVNILLPLRDASKLLLRLANTAGADKIVTIGAGANPPAFATAAQTVSVPATTGVMLAGPFDSARVLQADGTVNVDFGSGMTGTIQVYVLPQGY